MGAKYDEDAGRRATAEGKDLATLESQIKAREYRSDRDELGDGLERMYASADSPEGGDAESPTDGTRKLMDAFPDPYTTKPAPETDGLGEVGKKMLDVANRPGTPEDKAVRRLEDSVKNVGERVDWQVGMNEMQDKLDEKKVVWVGGKAYPWNEVYKGVDEVPNGNNVWEYNNQTGILSKNGEIVYKKGYSGKGLGWNNPEMVGVRNIGPPPNGIYEINSREKREKFGDSWALDETNPDFIEKIKRDPGTFYIHGDNKYVNRTASEGCIVIPRHIRNMMNDGDVLKVITK